MPNPYMDGVPVTDAEAANGLGFESVEQMRLLYTHIDEVQKIVGPMLRRIFGDRPRSQWCFEISAAVTEYFITCGGLPVK